MMRVSECRSCKAPIIWAWTTSHRRMPVDADPTENGTLILTELAGEVCVDVSTGDEETPRHRAHFATCPDADSWRKRGAE